MDDSKLIDDKSRGYGSPLAYFKFVSGEPEREKEDPGPRGRRKFSFASKKLRGK